MDEHPKFSLARQQAIFSRLFKSIEDYETDIRSDPIKHVSRANRHLGVLREAMNRAMYELNGGRMGYAEESRPAYRDLRADLMERNRRAYEILKEALNERVG